MKKILSFVLVVCIVSSVLGMFTISVCATTYTGSCGDNVTWTLDTSTGVLSITGSGAMKDYSWSINAPWYTERSYITSATISDGVTNIGNYAFYNCSSLTSVTIPNSVTNIGDYAFEGCSSITSVTIPDSVTNIGNHAFEGCSSLTSVTIPDSVTSISYCAFYNCSNLTSVTIQAGVTSIGDYAFYNCSNLTSVTFPDSVTSIGSYAFVGCSSLTDIYYNGTETEWNEISTSSSSNKDYLTNATIHYPITGSCGEEVNWKLDYYGNLTISGTGAMTDYSSDSSAPWYSYKDSVKTAVVETGVTSIGDYAFYYCSLKSVSIPDSVTSIGYCAFYFCPSLTNIIIPNSVTSIGGAAFYACKFTNIIIPDSVTSIGNSAFEMCTSLTSITIPGSVTTIGEYAFNYCARLTSATISNGVTSIGNYAFYDCNRLTSVYIPKSITSIGDYAFARCNRLKYIYYNGTEADWADITIGKYDDFFTNATKNYNYGKVIFDGEEVETYGSIVLGTDNGNGIYSLPENVVGYYIDDKFVDAGVYDVTGGEVITTVDFNVTMVNGAQVRYGGGLDENGKVTSGNGLRFLAQVDRSNFDGSGYGMKLTAEGSDKETIVDAEKWQDDTTFTVALTDMAESNYIRKFTATPYVVVKYDDGTEKTIYGTQSVTRSIYNISAGLLANDEEYADDLIAVLNAYVNQTGIRLVIGEIGGEIKAHSAKYGDTLHFAVSDAAYDSAGNAYSVILTAQGNAKIITDNDFWYEYIRINNNNSLIRDKVTVERVEGTVDAVKVVFYADGLIERPADKNDNTTTDPADDEFDGESEWN